MGFWLLVPGVGMGAGEIHPSAWFTLDNERPEFTLTVAEEFTADNGDTAFTL